MTAGGYSRPSRDWVPYKSRRNRLFRVRDDWSQRLTMSRVAVKANAAGRGPLRARSTVLAMTVPSVFPSVFHPAPHTE
jgi:hypothetical protein